jgi:caffeoyl-CoA O-methyltransferase
VAYSRVGFAGRDKEAVMSLRTWAAVMVVLFPVLATLAARQPENTSEAFRKRYLETFPWTLSNTTAGDAMFLRILVESRGAKSGVEVGTNTGYGAINMGIGFERSGGRLTTIEINPRTAAAARSHLAKVGLDKVVTVVEGDALKVLPTLQGPYDFVFIDALKPDYLKYLKALEPKLTPGAVIVADNVIDYAGQMPDYLEYVQSSPLYDTQIIRASMQKNDGMSVSYKIR